MRMRGFREAGPAPVSSERRSEGEPGPPDSGELRAAWSGIGAARPASRAAVGAPVSALMRYHAPVSARQFSGCPSPWPRGPPGPRKCPLSPPTRVYMALWSSRIPEVPPQSSDARLYGTLVLQDPGSAPSVLRRASLWHFGPPGSRKCPLSPPTRVSMALWSSRNPEVTPQSSHTRLYGTLVLQKPGSAPSVLRRASLWHFGPPETRKCPLSPPTCVSMALWSSRIPEVPPQSSDAHLYGTLVLQDPGSAPSVLRRASLWHFGPPGTRKCPLSPPTRVSMALWSSRIPEVPPQSSDARLYGTLVLQDPGNTHPSSGNHMVPALFQNHKTRLTVNHKNI
ncbi:uncharacterized protein FN964_009064 [Alca torda]